MAVIAAWWGRYLLPAIVDRTMAGAQLAELRYRVTGVAHGSVLEIGIGSGHNLGFYPRQLTSLVGVDPSMALLRRAHRRAAWMAFPVHLRQGRAERLPLPDGSVDVVVSTWTLGAVADPRAVLQEVRRVLKPGGRFSFVEHGGEDRPARAPWRRLVRAWRRLLGTGRLAARPDVLIEQAGLRLESLEGGPAGDGSADGWQWVGLARAPE